MKKTVFLFLIILSNAYPQDTERSISYNDIIFSENIILPGDSLYNVFVTFRIPYNRLVFEKKGDQFEAGYRLVFELFRDSVNFMERQISEEKLNAVTFEQTDSDQLTKEGIVKFNVPAGEYKIVPVLTDLKTNREMHLKSSSFYLKDKQEVFSPIIVKKDKDCGENQYHLVNFNGDLPFSPSAEYIILPVTNNPEDYTVIVKNKEKDLGAKKADVEKDLAGLELCDHGIYLTKNVSNNISLIVIDPGQQYTEGEIQVISKNKITGKEERFQLRSVWFNKPYSLRNTKTAVNLIKFIDEEEYEKLDDASDDELDTLFFSYWKKFDPTPNTAFNELMNEFYTRADYAARNFNSVTGKKGLESDRGKIYIKFGKPEKVERTSDSQGKVVEIWHYANNRKFSFIDEKGTGEFNLFEG